MSRIKKLITIKIGIIILVSVVYNANEFTRVSKLSSSEVNCLK